MTQAGADEWGEVVVKVGDFGLSTAHSEAPQGGGPRGGLLGSGGGCAGEGEGEGLAAKALQVGLFCLIIGLFCLIIGLFCLIIGLFCLIIGLFCLIRGRTSGEGPAGAHSQTSSLYAFLQQIYQGADFSECALQHTVGFYFLFYSVNKIHIHTLILTTYMAPEHLLFYIIIIILFRFIFYLFSILWVLVL